jgi:hypothetical protein
MGLPLMTRCVIVCSLVALCCVEGQAAGEYGTFRTRGAATTPTALTGAGETDNGAPAPATVARPASGADNNLSGLLSENLIRATETDSGATQAGYVLAANTPGYAAGTVGTPVRTAPGNVIAPAVAAPASVKSSTAFTLSPLEIALALISLIGIGAGGYLAIRRRA